MQYYIHSIEQTKIDGVLNEYGGTQKVADENSALREYYKKLSNVSADLDKNHTYMNIRLVDSRGVQIKSDIIGKYEEVTE